MKTLIQCTSTIAEDGVLSWHHRGWRISLLQRLVPQPECVSLRNKQILHCGCQMML